MGCSFVVTVQLGSVSLVARHPPLLGTGFATAVSSLDLGVLGGLQRWVWWLYNLHGRMSKIISSSLMWVCTRILWVDWSFFGNFLQISQKRPLGFYHLVLPNQGIWGLVPVIWGISCFKIRISEFKWRSSTRIHPTLRSVSTGVPPSYKLRLLINEVRSICGHVAGQILQKSKSIIKGLKPRKHVIWSNTKKALLRVLLKIHSCYQK